MNIKRLPIRQLAGFSILLCAALFSNQLATSHSESWDGIDSVTAPDNLIGYQSVISFMGFPNDTTTDALDPAVAYNSQDHLFLVVWSGEGEVNTEWEIWGQRVDAATGIQLGPDFQISGSGAAGDAEDPDVAYNPATNEFFVVWSADGVTDNRFEIFGRYLNAQTGALIDSQHRYSDMLPLGDTNYDAIHPAVTYNTIDNEFAIAWSADTNVGDLVDNEYEIWVQRVAGQVGPLPDGQKRISLMGGKGDASYDALEPDIVYNSTGNQYLVVWEGDTILPGFQDNDYEIFGQCLTSDLSYYSHIHFQISHMGALTDHWADAQSPAVTYNAKSNQYLVVWHGDSAADGDFEVYGQLLYHTCYLVSPNDIQISHVVRNANSNYVALSPDVTWNSVFNEYLVVWQDDKAGVQEYEIWGQRVAADASLISYNRQISEMGPPGNAAYFGQTPAVAYSDHFSNLSLVTWAGEHNVDGKMEIYIHRFGGEYRVMLPLVMR